MSDHAPAAAVDTQCVDESKTQPRPDEDAASTDSSAEPLLNPKRGDAFVEARRAFFAPRPTRDLPKE